VCPGGVLMLTRSEAEAVALQAAEYPQHDEAGRAKLGTIAAGHHRREAEDFRAFAAVDQAAYAERIAASVVRAAADLEAARGAETEAERKAAEALQAERARQDRVREHAEYARQMQEAWRHVQGRGGPQAQADALRGAQNAAQVAQGEQAALEGKAAARALADRELEAARARTGEAEDALRATRELAGHPGRALYSPQTCAENVPHLLRIWDTLQPMEQQLVRQAISTFAMLTGLYDDIKAKGAAEREAENEGQGPAPAPLRGPFTMPGTVGR
jgi:hypothetical protein